jgi:hypothetical protein
VSQPAAVSVADSDSAANSFPFSAPVPDEGAAQAVAIAPKPDVIKAPPESGSETQTLFWMMTLTLMAIPGFLLMALIATVLVRR